MPDSDQKFKPERARKSNQKKPIEAEAYYTIADLSDRNSPYYLASMPTIFRCLADGRLKSSKVGRRRFIKGSQIHEWLAGHCEAA